MYKAGIARDMIESVGKRHCAGRRRTEQSERAGTGKTREFCTDPMASGTVGKGSP